MSGGTRRACLTEVGGQGDLPDAPGVGLLLEAPDGGVELVQRRRRCPGRVVRLAEQPQVGGGGRCQPVQDGLQRLPKVRSLPEPAGQEQHVEGRGERIVGRVVLAIGLDGSHQQPVGGFHVAMAVEQQEGAGGGGLERGTGTELRVGLPGLGEEPGSGFEPTGQGGGDEGRLGQPSTAVATPGAEVGGPVQPHGRAHAVTAGEKPAGGLFEQRGDLLVGFVGRFRQVPRSTVGLVDPRLGQGAVSLVPLAPRREPDDRRAGERVAEHHPPPVFVDVHESGPFGGDEVPQPRIAGRGPQDTELTGPVHHGQQQQPAGGGRQVRDPRREQGLQSIRERQGHRQ